MTQPISEANTAIPGVHPDKKVGRLSRCLSSVVLLALPSFHASRASHLDPTFRHRSTTLLRERDPQTPSTLSGGSHTSIEDSWAVYLNACVAEWKIVFTLACVLVGLSLAMFQIPTAANDPFTHAFASLTQCRAFSGLVYAAILQVYFEGEYTRTGRFAMLWWKSVVESKDNIWNTWVMLSLPAASTLWALLFYLLTMLSFFFRPTLTPDNHPTPIALTVMLQAIIAVSLLSDLICVAYIWITLKAYRKKYYANHEEV